MARLRPDRADGTTPPVRSVAAARHSDDPAVGPARHLGIPRRLPAWLKIGTAVVSVLLVGVLAFGAYWVVRLQGNISKASLGAGSSTTERAVNESHDRMQILILGSDTRDGKNSQYGTADDSTGYGHSDVMMLMDISADNKRVNVVSFPRDLLVDIPKCRDQETRTDYPAQQDVMINAAMSEAGIGCAVDTVNKLTGLEVDHFMMADFNAVKELSNAVGGVEVCISDAVFDPDSQLRLPKGTSAVQGEQALAFLRTRHAFADGGDLGRIKAQQGFLSSLTRKMKDEGTLGNPAKMLQIADVVTRNLTVNEGLASIPTLLAVGNRLKDIDVGKVAFVAVPTVPAAIDPNRLQMAEPAASQLFAAMRKDIDLTNPTASPTNPTASPADPGASAAPTASETAPAYDKASQPVTVANGSGVPARSAEIMQSLMTGGFTQLAQLTARPVATTAVYYGAGYGDVAADVAALLGVPAAQVLPVATVPGVQVYLGSDRVGGAATGNPPVALPPDIVNQTAGDTVCQQANPALITR
ncbi:LCP family protein required for cell wall assembly [Arthrobacter sp. V4I6]|uniref:LCP family protein n=1 Tax=unclassified Arthrobacter TaxID=235627 RepID=UPI00278AF874|nr:MULTISPECIES: LCP family protein [unclassified Arthrobacter]MDQ0820953.1 LCP family protein required for cell wall assembly [Arthrobacter sp. V1I7]MDQ0855214.1 LCP family protein required for cell wall assembly [Arthrobacter sp. V4I6]